MINVNIICVGKLKEEYLRNACKEYEKRLSAFCRLNIIELTPYRLPDNPSKAQIDAALEEEGERILAKTEKDHMIYAMCIEGKERNSEVFAEELSSFGVQGYSSVDFIIGGSFGLSPAVKQAAKIKMSMSSMTFPHQLARVMLLEQIYRGFMISNGGKYHK